MYKYVGDFEYLKKLGFINDISKEYWYLPTKSGDRYLNPITINIDDRTVEYTMSEQLEIIKKYIKLI